MDLFLIDAIGPFFRGYEKRTINWSKIPFEHLPTRDPDPDARSRHFAQIRDDMETFASRVSALGYNAATLDDLAHLAQSDLYEPGVQAEINVLRDEFRPLFGILQEHGLTPYLTADILSYTPALLRAVSTDPEAIADFLADLIDRFFTDFPEVAGLIFRIGESDGKDVTEQSFQSQLVLRKPREVNLVLRRLLPVFEKHGRRLILRTWTVGAYHVGDLIWHRGTLARTLRDIDSDAFVLSMKYGESDFFRYLPLNRAFFNVPHQKIIEIQGRREYEGCGEFPSFIGEDYHRLASELRQVENVIGLSTWCQTGGWVPFRRLTFLEPEGIWNEINCAVAIALFRDGVSVEDAVGTYARDHGIADPAALLELLRLSENAIKELFYIPGFARQRLFFRRVRIPPLISLYWDNLFINHSVKMILTHLVEDGEHAVVEGQAALEKIAEMRPLAERLGLPAEDIDFMRATGEMLSLAREYYFRPFTEETATRIEEAKRRYKERFPRGTRPRYRIRANFRPFRFKRWHLTWTIALATRKKHPYRILDHLFTVRLLGLLYHFIQRRPNLMPKVLRETAMGMDTVLR